MLGGPETPDDRRGCGRSSSTTVTGRWPASAVVMLAVLIIPIILFNRNQAKELEARHETFRFC